MEEPTAATAEAGAIKGTDRWKPSRVPFRPWKPPPKRSRSWMRSFPGCEVRANPLLGGGCDLVRFFGPMVRKASVRASQSSWLMLPFHQSRAALAETSTWRPKITDLVQRSIPDTSVRGDIPDLNDPRLLGRSQTCLQFLQSLRKTPIDHLRFLLRYLGQSGPFGSWASRHACARMRKSARASSAGSIGHCELSSWGALREPAIAFPVPPFPEHDGGPPAEWQHPVPGRG